MRLVCLAYTQQLNRLQYVATLSPDRFCPKLAPHLPVQEDSFHLVDNRPTQKNKGQRRFNPQRFAHRNTQFNRGQPEQPHQARQKQQKQRQFQNFHRDNQRVMHNWRLRIWPQKLGTFCSELQMLGTPAHRCLPANVQILSLCMLTHAAVAVADRHICSCVLTDMQCTVVCPLLCCM